MQEKPTCPKEGMSNVVVVLPYVFISSWCEHSASIYAIVVSCSANQIIVVPGHVGGLITYCDVTRLAFH